MKKTLLLLPLILLALFIRVNAQCNPLVPDTAFIVSNDSVFDVGGWDTGNITPHDYLICSGKTLTYNVVSSFPINFYVAQGGTLILKSCQMSNAHLEQGATFIIDTTNNYFDPFVYQIVCDTSAVTILDTHLLANHPMVIHCPGNVLDFSNFPGGVSPCSGAADISDFYSESRLSVYPNPSQGNFRIFPFEREYQIRIMDLFGREIPGISADNEGFVNMNAAAGVYLLEIRSGETLLETKKIEVF